MVSFCPPSERFFVRLNKSGLPKAPDKTERQCTLFVVSQLGSGCRHANV